MYNITIYKVVDFDFKENNFIITNEDIPFHKNMMVYTNRLDFFILGVMNDSRCYKSNYKNNIELFNNRTYSMKFKELKTIKNINKDIVNNTMKYIDDPSIGFDGWAFLKYLKYSKLLNHPSIFNEFKEIKENIVNDDIFVLYERVA